MRSERDRWALAIDFGTSVCSAAVATGDAVDLLDLHGDHRIPSMVLLDESGELLVGAVAASQAAVAPERLERRPKTQVGKAPVLLLGATAVPVVEAVGALMSAFVTEARRRRGDTEPAAVVLTHPVRWGPDRRAVLVDAVVSTGVARGRVQLVEEPVAAASALRSARIRPGDLVAVYDLGGGTFDAAVVRATEAGFVVAGSPGGDDAIGGETFDERLLAHVGERVSAVDPELWRALCEDEGRSWRRAYARLSEDIPRLKETLSVATQATVYVPLLDRDVTVTRAEFERLIEADVEHTLARLEAVVEAAGARPEELAAIYLVGGSSRIPLVSGRLLERYGERAVTWDDPQSAVTLGAARQAQRALRDVPAERDRAAPPPSPAPPPPRGRRRSRAVVYGTIAAVAATIAIISAIDDGDPRAQPSPSVFTLTDPVATPTGSPRPYGTVTPGSGLPLEPVKDDVETVPALGAIVRHDGTGRARVVLAVRPEDGAARLAPDDVIVAAGGRNLTRYRRLDDLLAGRRVRSEIAVRVRRDGRAQTLAIKLASPDVGLRRSLQAMIPDSVRGCRRTERNLGAQYGLQCPSAIKRVTSVEYSLYARTEDLARAFATLIAPGLYAKGNCSTKWWTENLIRSAARPVGRIRCGSNGLYPTLEWIDTRVNLGVALIAAGGTIGEEISAEQRSALLKQYRRLRPRG